MKKDRSNQPSSPNRSLRLPKKRILRGRDNFQRLFDDQTAVAYFTSHIKIRFCVFDDKTGGCKMGFIVPKRLGNAVQRNRVKRLFREAYRLNQYMLTDLITASSVSLHGALMAKSIGIDFETTEAEVISLLGKVQAYMHSTFEL
jgi:ribonuclease P protein component